MKFRFSIIALVAVFTCGAAYAGLYQPAEVEVDLTTNFAAGDMWSGRVDDDDEVYIGCGARRISDGAGGVFYFSFCQAQDADGELAFCNATDPELVQAIDAFSDYSYVTFSWELNEFGDGICTRIGHSTQSFYLPKFRVRN